MTAFSRGPFLVDIPERVLTDLPDAGREKQELDRTKWKVDVGPMVCKGFS
jgi:hypothetical protein